TIGAVAFQTAFQGCAVHLDVLDRHLGRAGDDIRDIVFRLSHSRPAKGREQQQRQESRMEFAHSPPPLRPLEAARSRPYCDKENEARRSRTRKGEPTTFVSDAGMGWQ